MGCVWLGCALHQGLTRQQDPAGNPTQSMVMHCNAITDTAVACSNALCNVNIDITELILHMTASKQLPYALSASPRASARCILSWGACALWCTTCACKTCSAGRHTPLTHLRLQVSQLQRQLHRGLVLPQAPGCKGHVLAQVPQVDPASSHDELRGVGLQALLPHLASTQQQPNMSLCVGVQIVNKSSQLVPPQSTEHTGRAHTSCARKAGHHTLCCLLACLKPAQATGLYAYKTRHATLNCYAAG
jgi:hypothetical protein